ncbi:hypothetical protein EON80_31235 [bacterium]|nr:MAG: hypothetical protein EON80_31235 [bacterium]
MTQDQAAAELMGIGIGALIAAAVGFAVSADARRRGFTPNEAFGWGAGVFLLMAVFLPLYLIFRWKRGDQPVSLEKVATVACPYCGYLNKSGANFCEKCNRQLKSSSEIHPR